MSTLRTSDNSSLDLGVVEILGCRVSRTTIAQSIGLIEKWITEPYSIPRYIVATGFHGIWEAHKNPELLRVLNSADLFCPDGIAPVWLSRLQESPLCGRVTGPDLLLAFLKRANLTGYSSFFFGDTIETLEALRERVQTEFPGHGVAGLLSPPFRSLTVEEDKQILEEINRAAPDILWVGLGMPKQEWWIHRHLGELRVPVVAGIGAALRFVSGQVRRAPGWIGDHGLEWLWRLGMEPRKLWRRDLIDGPRFLAYALLEHMRERHTLTRS